MSLSKLSEELTEALNHKRQHDELLGTIKALHVQQQVTNMLLGKISRSSDIEANKLTNIEMRQDMDCKSDLQGATRHTESWALGSCANVSPSHLDILIDKLLAPGAQMGQLSYGYEMLHKDSRRTLGILFRLWLAMRNKNPIKIQWQGQMFQTGFGIEMLPAFGEAVCKRAKITMGEDGAKKVKEVIDKFQDDAEWQAMMKLAVPVDNHFKEVVHADSKQSMLPAHAHEQKKMTSEEFKTILKACPIKIQKCYERTKDTVWDQIWNPPNSETIEINESPELFTQCMLEVYQCLEIFNLTSSYSKANDFRKAKSARDYKLKMFAILKDNFKEEHDAYEVFVKSAKTTPEGRKELKEIWSSLSDMGQNVFEADHAELYEEPEKKPQEQ